MDADKRQLIRNSCYAFTVKQLSKLFICVYFKFLAFYSKTAFQAVYSKKTILKTVRQCGKQHK